MELTELKHKSLQFELSGADEEQGIFEGYASVFGVLDSDGDIVDRGAFTKTIAEGMAKDGATILALHNDRLLPVGKTLELREDDIGLYIKGYISPTSMGKDVRILVRDRVLKELSIGYMVKRYTVRADARHLEEIELLEISVVTWAANSSAKISGYKGGVATGSSISELLAEGRELIARLQELGVDTPDDGAELIEIND